MAKKLRGNPITGRGGSTTKYDAQNTVLAKTYGALADLRRELADSKAAVEERGELLKLFSTCADSQRAWLLLEDYFERLALARKDFSSYDWWPRMVAVFGRERLEELALLFLRTGRPLPTELTQYANFERFALIEEQEQEQKLLNQVEKWILPPTLEHLDVTRASFRLRCAIEPAAPDSQLKALTVEFILSRPRTGEKARPMTEIMDLISRATHEQELFPPEDWQIIQWLGETYGKRAEEIGERVTVQGAELLHWLARWGHTRCLTLAATGLPIEFHGQLAQITHHLDNGDKELSLTHRLALPEGGTRELSTVQFFGGSPSLALVDQTVFLLRNSPSPELLGTLARRPSLPVRRLGHRLLRHLRKAGGKDQAGWDLLCVTHSARPQFIFELTDETVRLRLMATSEREGSHWQWNGHEWQKAGHVPKAGDKPEILDDSRLDEATQWLRQLDWFTPEPGLWVGDTNENFLATLADAWPQKPAGADYLGNQAFQRLFLTPRQLKPRIMVAGSGIDWLSVSAEWEAEGLRLTTSDLEQLQAATGRFVKLPDAGWVELDTDAVESAHEAMAELGLENLTSSPQQVGLLQIAEMEEEDLERYGNKAQVKQLKDRLAEFRAMPATPIPSTVQADMRPYQKDGFDFLCHLTRNKLGGVLADDMGLGKTLQTLTWLAWLKTYKKSKARPALVICPASVLHNWRREANRFVPGMKVLILESGAARHNLRKQIPQHDLIVTNYALLRRDLEALQKFEFNAIILDEAQFIKNPAAQVTQSVKQLQGDHRLALTGTPLENRLLDLWSIVDFIQPGYLGSQAKFTEIYEPKGENAEFEQKMARKRLSAKLKPVMIRRLKIQVAKDLPERIEERRDCDLDEAQRKLYLAELRRSREQVMKTVQEKGVAKSKMHVLAALTRLRQICCHPRLVGSDCVSGKTETLFELLEPLLAEGQKVLLFSQFVQMLELLERECKVREMPTHILTGETKNRQEVVNAFQNDTRASVFLLSLRAAGTGLNLTTASYVILYDPWWNPAVEAQAIDRSHRIGQTRTVNAYRLISPGTVEEKIWELQQRKAQTISDVLGEEGFARNLSENDLDYLFSED